MATKESSCIDILQLLHDIHHASSSQAKPFTHYLNKISFVNNRLMFESHADLVQFIKQTANIQKKKYVASNIQHSHNIPINWLSVFYNPSLKDISQKLAIISPILSLYKRNETNHKQYHMMEIIRKCIPSSSHIKGIEDDNYLYLNMYQLFGTFTELNMQHLSMDLCKQIVSYLDLTTFFKSSLINHCWLNFIYRHNTFNVMLKQCVNMESMKCVLVDHSSLNRMEAVHITKIFINWQLRSNSKYLDFITLRKSWIEHFIDTESIQITLQQYKNNTNDESQQWLALKSVDRTIKKLFDSMDVFGCIMDDIKKENDGAQKPTIYRLRIQITSPFEWVFYSEARTLNPRIWHQKYHSNQIGIDTEQQFWFEYYIELLFSMIDGDISQALTTIMEAAQRMKFDHVFVTKKLLDPMIMRQLIRLLMHKEWRIQHNVAILLANLYATKDAVVREQYLHLSTFGIQGYNVIDVTLKSIHNILQHASSTMTEGEYRGCRSLICVVGNYVISKHANDTWKKLALAHPVQYISFMIRRLKQEAHAPKHNEPMNINQWSFRAMALWSLSTFYRYKSEDDQVNKQLNGDISRQLIMLFLEWTVKVGELYLINDKLMHQKMNKLFNKSNKTQHEFDIEQRCYSTVLAETCIGIQRIYSNKYHELEHVLDINIAQILAAQVLDICSKCIDTDWAQYLTHVSLKLIAQTLRLNGGFTKRYLDSKLSEKLNSVLHIIKNTLPNEKSIVGSFKKWIKKRNSANISTVDNKKEIQKIESFIELYDDVLDIVNSLTQYSDFFSLTEIILDILCIYAQRDSYEQHYIQHVVAYLWNSLTFNPSIYKNIIIKHKSFIKLLNYWVKNADKYGPVFNSVVSNLHAVLNDTHLFKKTFSKQCHMNDGDDDEKHDFVHCPCGNMLQLIAASDCYASSLWLYCDLCFQKISGSTKVYHCDKKEPEHKNGYDLCLSCVKRRL